MNLTRLILFCLLTTLVHPVLSYDFDTLDNEQISVGTSSNVSETKVHKFYLHPSQIAITTSGLYCYLSDAWLPISGLPLGHVRNANTKMVC